MIMNEYKTLAALIGIDCPDAGQPFPWRGLSVVIIARQDWIELFDTSNGRAVVSVARASGQPLILARKDGRQYGIEPAPAGYYRIGTDYINLFNDEVK